MERNGSMEHAQDWLETLDRHYEDLALHDPQDRRRVRDKFRSELEALYLNAEAAVEVVAAEGRLEDKLEDRLEDGLGPFGIPTNEAFEPVAIATFAGPISESSNAVHLPPPPELTFVPDVGWTTLVEFGNPAVRVPGPRTASHRRPRHRGRSSLTRRAFSG